MNKNEKKLRDEIRKIKIERENNPLLTQEDIEDFIGKYEEKLTYWIRENIRLKKDLEVNNFYKEYWRIKAQKYKEKIKEINEKK